jgi:DNA-directed RNA polymerase subunit RPC12/RpoP
MAGKCPGQDTRNLRSAFYKCPKCSALVEIFSDELRFRCRNCGEYVIREKTPSCIEWCSHAKECLGEQKWQELGGKVLE